MVTTRKIPKYAVGEQVFLPNGKKGVVQSSIWDGSQFRYEILTYRDGLWGYLERSLKRVEEKK